MEAGDRITVITVVKNAAVLLEKTILNVIVHKADYEIDFLVIDGGSTDGTTDIIQKYAEHITFWVSEPDNGIYDAMNKGWAAAADNSFIMFLGAGDRIVSLPHAMSRYDAKDVVYGSVRMGDKVLFKPRADFHLKLYNSIHHQALLVNKALHPAPPFDCKYEIYADFDFNQRLKKRRARFVFAPDFVGYAYPGGVSDRDRFFDSLRVVSANYGYFWATLACFSYFALRMLPVLKRLRPITPLS